MATFLEDLDDDRDNVFLDVLEFADALTGHIVRTGVDTAFNGVVEDTSLPDEHRITVIYSVDDVTLDRGDKVTHESLLYTIERIETDEGVATIVCGRGEARN